MTYYSLPLFGLTKCQERSRTTGIRQTKDDISRQRQPNVTFLYCRGSFRRSCLAPPKDRNAGEPLPSLAVGGCLPFDHLVKGTAEKNRLAMARMRSLMVVAVVGMVTESSRVYGSRHMQQISSSPSPASSSSFGSTLEGDLLDSPQNSGDPVSHARCSK